MQEKKHSVDSISQSLLKEIKAVSNYSLEKIALETDIAYLTIYRIYYGLTKNPRTTTFQKIFKIYCKTCQSCKL